MHLATDRADWAYNWAIKNCVQSKDSRSLAFFVEASGLYRKFCDAAFAHNIEPLPFAQFWTMLQIAFPGIEAKRNSTGNIFTGIRYA